MVVDERGLSPLRVLVVLFSIQIIFFLYHVALTNPGYVNLAAVIPWAVKVSGKMGECMEVEAWWLVYGVTKPPFCSAIGPDSLDGGSYDAFGWR